MSHEPVGLLEAYLAWQSGAGVVRRGYGVAPCQDATEWVIRTLDLDLQCGELRDRCRALEKVRRGRRSSELDESDRGTRSTAERNTKLVTRLFDEQQSTTNGSPTTSCAKEKLADTGSITARPRILFEPDGKARLKRWKSRGGRR